MKCTRTMVVTGVVLLAVLALTYAALPQFRTLVVSAGPYLLFLLCPLAMIFMMIGMRSSKDDHRPSTDETSRDRQPQSQINKQ